MENNENYLDYECPKVVAIDVREYCAKLSSCGSALLNNRAKGCMGMHGPYSECDARW